ncbi:MAG: ExbD/TolR family protein [Verrucomicrobiales bacterium]|nr:biopolymer transporter ExbD [Verrucomicrobiae bacterium]MCP5554969.1 biopolymer transporter ExbD [Akkermansiaceae bacterium]
MPRKFPAPEVDEPELDISSMIDVSFLLLIYFLVTSTIDPKETDLGMKLPTTQSSEATQVKVDQMTIQVSAEGNVVLNDEPLETDATKRDLPLLNERLKQYVDAAKLSQSDPLVVVAADDASKGQRFIDVLNSIAKAGIKNVTITGFKDN